MAVTQAERSWVMFRVVRLRHMGIFLVLAVLLIAALVGRASYVPVDAQPTLLEAEGVKLPIVMYHSVLKSRSNAFIVSPAQLEADLQYLQAHDFHTVTVEDLIDYVYNEKELPEKPIMITFDDGHLNNITYAEPLLRQYGMKAVIAVVGVYTDTATAAYDPNPNYAYLTWADLKDIVDGGVFEVQCHSYDLHQQSKSRKGADKGPWVSTEEYEAYFAEDIQKFRESMRVNTGCEVTAFVYPFGSNSSASEAAVQKTGFLASLTCRQRINTITRDPQSLYSLGRFNRPSGLDSEAYFRKILKGYE